MTDTTKPADPRWWPTAEQFEAMIEAGYCIYTKQKSVHISSWWYAPGGSAMTDAYPVRAAFDHFRRHHIPAQPVPPEGWRVVGFRLANKGEHYACGGGTTEASCDARDWPGQPWYGRVWIVARVEAAWPQVGDRVWVEGSIPGVEYKSSGWATVLRVYKESADCKFEIQIGSSETWGVCLTQLHRASPTQPHPHADLIRRLRNRRNSDIPKILDEAADALEGRR